MGRRGPQPKPARLKALAGNPGKRKPPASAAATVERPDQSPPAPRHLPPLARQWWAEYVPVLHREQRLATEALPALQMAAAAYSSWRVYEREAGKVGPVSAVQMGLRNAANQARADYMRIMRQFGADPLSHGALKGLPAPPDQEDEARARREGFFGVAGGRDA